MQNKTKKDLKLESVFGRGHGRLEMAFPDEAPWADSVETTSMRMRGLSMVRIDRLCLGGGSAKSPKSSKSPKIAQNRPNAVLVFLLFPEMPLDFFPICP
jgi:hypothetical protein